MAASKTLSMVMAVMMIAGLSHSVSAVTHTVTWTFGTSATQFDDWANQQTFQVNDVIAFIYDAAAHNVFEVNRADLDSCNLNNPIVKYEESNATVTLSRSGYHGFICGVNGHCSQGNMKMNVQVSAATTPSPPQSPVSSPTVSPPTSSPPTPSSSSPPTESTPDSPIPAPVAGPAPDLSDASSLQSLPAMVVGALVAGCASVLL